MTHSRFRSGRPSRFAAGSALVETTLTIALLLLLVMAGIRIGTIGIYQIQADGAAWVDAHLVSIGTDRRVAETTAANIFRLPFTHANAGFSNSTVPSPNNSPYPLTAGNDADAWRGGASTLAAMSTQTVVRGSMLLQIPFFPKADVRLQGASAEFVPSVYGLTDSSYYGKTIPWNARMQTTAGGLASTALPYFGSLQDAPPFFVQTDVMAVCNERPSSDATAHWTTCNDTPSASNASSSSARGMGVAMALGRDNWARPINGVSPEGAAVFWEALYHQQTFARIALAIQAAGPMPVDQTAADGWIGKLDGQTDVANVPYWDMPPGSPGRGGSGGGGGGRGGGGGGGGGGFFGGGFPRFDGPGGGFVDPFNPPAPGGGGGGGGPFNLGYGSGR